MRAFALVFTVLLLATRTYAHDEDSFEAEGSLGWTAAEKKSGHDRLLAMPAIKQLASINAGLNALAARDAAACNWMNQLTGPETLAKQINAFDANPAVKGVIEGENMTVRDYLVTLHAVSETAIVVHAAEQKIAVRIDVLPSNVAFYRQHRTEIERLLDGPDPC
jgi:hypothetical protein